MLAAVTERLKDNGSKRNSNFNSIWVPDYSMQSHSFLPSFFSIITSRTLSSITELNMHHRTSFLARGKAKKKQARSMKVSALEWVGIYLYSREREIKCSWATIKCNRASLCQQRKISWGPGSSERLTSPVCRKIPLVTGNQRNQFVITWREHTESSKSWEGNVNIRLC